MQQMKVCWVPSYQTIFYILSSMNMGELFTEKSRSYLMMKNGRIAKFVAEPRATHTKAKRELLPKFHKLKENVQITNGRLRFNIPP